VRWVDRHGGDRATPYFFVRFAVRYRANGVAAPEVTGARLYSLEVASTNDVLEGDALEVAADAMLEKAPRSLVLSSLPGWFGASALAPLEKSVRERLPDKLETTLLFDPVTKGLSAPGESPEAFAARLSPAAAAPAALRERLEKKRRELEAAEAQEKGRSLEKWASVGTAAVDILGGLLGRRKTIRVGKVGSVLTKQRMEGAVEAKIDALKAEIADLEAKVAPPDPSRFESIHVVPLKAHVDVLALGVAWVS
jgi:hypothetical protein